MQRDLLLLGEMIDAIEQIQQLAADITLDELDERRERRDALLWNYTVLGEAAGQISTETRARFPDVAWQQPARLRNRIVHGYWSIDMEILLTTARRQLPALATELREVLTAPPRTTEPARQTWREWRRRRSPFWSPLTTEHRDEQASPLMIKFLRRGRLPA